jgi:hypothetical protein
MPLAQAAQDRQGHERLRLLSGRGKLAYEGFAPNLRQLSLERRRFPLDTRQDHVDSLMALDRHVNQNHLLKIHLFPNIVQQGPINFQGQNSLQDLMKGVGDGRFPLLLPLLELINALGELVLRLLERESRRDVLD